MKYPKEEYADSAVEALHEVYRAGQSGCSSDL